MWVLPINISDSKCWSKITEDVSEKASDLRFDEGNRRLVVVAITVEFDCFLETNIRENYCLHNKIYTIYASE